VRLHGALKPAIRDLRRRSARERRSQLKPLKDKAAALEEEIARLTKEITENRRCFCCAETCFANDAAGAAENDKAACRGGAFPCRMPNSVGSRPFSGLRRRTRRELMPQVLRFGGLLQERLDFRAKGS